MWYAYDALSRVTKRTVKNACNAVVSEETYTYDAAGNITDAPDSCFGYGTNNRLTTFMERSVSYDADGNMLSARLDGANMALSYDVSNRLVSAGGHTYTYNAEDVRIRNVCNGYDTTYTYNTNGRLSQLLMKTTNGITTKYVYGLGLIGEEKQGEFKTYHFDYRGSTVALTDSTGSITDTFEYDTYGNVTERTGDSFVIFGYNGRDGVVTDKNGLIYMRARYYSPEMRRFVNADILRGEISDSTSLNRYSYVNGNPVSFVDPFGLSADDRIPNSNEKNIILVLYDAENFSRQAQDEVKYLSSTYDYDEIITESINSKEEFIKVWNKYANSLSGISLIFHGSPKHIWIGEDFMVDDVRELKKTDAEFLRLLSCNGGHKDVSDNMANAFRDNHDIDQIYAMDGNLSFYPRNWYLIGHNYSKYGPRLSFSQDGFNKYASTVRKFVGPNVGTGYINEKRKPTGFYLIE